MKNNTEKKLKQSHDAGWKKGYDEGYENGCDDTELALLYLLKNTDIKKIYIRECKRPKI